MPTPACYWGTGLETGTTLYLRLAGDREPHALRFHHALLRDCGAGRYARQDQAILLIRRTLKKMGILPASHAREVRPWPRSPSLMQRVSRFCRKFAFLRPNVKVVCRKINDL